jgi:hypothetical protein
VSAYLRLDGVLGNELVDMNYFLLANPRWRLYQTTRNGPFAYLPIASVDGLTLNAFLPPTGVEEISWDISVPL